MGRLHRGITIGMVLSVILLATVMTSALISTGLVHLFLSSRDNSRQIAQDLADSAIAQAADAVMTAPTFGASAAQTITATFPGAPSGAKGVVLFQPLGKAAPNDPTQPISFNNFQGTSSSLNGWMGRLIPANSADIMAIGRCGDEVRIREMVLSAPNFPYCIASTGPILLTGTMVAGLNGTQLNAQGQPAQSMDPSSLVGLGPGDVASMSTNPTAISLDPKTLVMGDAEAGGGVSVNGAQVKGEIRQYLGPPTASNSPVPIPYIDVASKIALLSTMSNDPSTDSADGLSGTVDLSLNSFYYQKGSWTVNGDLNLNGACVLVAPDPGSNNTVPPANQNAVLTVTGKVTGTGCIVVQGSVDIQNNGGASNLIASDTAAIVATGPITITAPGAQNNVFNGLLYSQSGLTANGITLVGSVVVNTTNGPTGATGALNLTDCQVVQVPGLQTFYSTVTSGNGGQRTFSFSKGSGGGLGGFLLGGLGVGVGWGGKHAGRFVPVDGNSQRIDVGIKVTWNKPTPNSYTISAGPAGSWTVTLDPKQYPDPSKDPALTPVINGLEGYVKGQEPNIVSLLTFGAGGGSTFDSGQFQQTIAGIDATIASLGSTQVVSIIKPVPTTNSAFYIDLNQALDPADQMRAMMWCDVNPQDVNRTSKEW